MRPDGFADTFQGDANANVIHGFAGDDLLRGGAGADVIDGDVGFDTASYADAAAGVTILLTESSSRSTGMPRATC